MIERSQAMWMCYAIPGWMWPVELGWLYDAMKESRRHAEIGVFCGRSLLATAAGMRLKSAIWAIDSLQNCPAGPEWTRSVLRATTSLIDSKTNATTEIMEMDSISACRELHGRGIKLDSIFIDGCHEYAECKADIDAWTPLVRQGGLIAGHDYWPKDSGVMDAVNETGDFSVAPGTRIWWRRA